MVQSLVFFLLLIHGALALNSGKQWQTLNGEAPLVIARGGYSGLFPDASSSALEFAQRSSLKDLALFCDLQMSKDGMGFCLTNLRLDNSTNISQLFPKGSKAYSVNGEELNGWFPVDFTSVQLQDVSLSQNIYSRTNVFDGFMPLSPLDDVAKLRPANLWINVQYNSFYKQHNLDMVPYIIESSKLYPVDYVSSPEIGFLKSLSGKLPKTKLVFRFLDEDAEEPSTKQTYGDILKNLKSVSSFASGILVPKNQIWPVENHYLKDHTSLVTDAHKQGLEVFADGFANDLPGSYNYSYDPSAEYLQFIDNSEFSVDGVLTDFPSTASQAVACFAHNNNTSPGQSSSSNVSGKPLVITHNGASGIYAGSTDLAYQKAVDDGADIIDCSVQLSKDGVPFCQSSADLMSETNAMVTFISRSSLVPQIQAKTGIFSFDLTWNEIQTLKPMLGSPYPAEINILRNPAFKNAGKIISLSDFLDLAKEKAVPGVLIDIQNAAFLASQKGLDVVDEVEKALSKVGFEKGTTQQVLIQSDDSSVLSKFTSHPTYKRVLYIEDIVGGAAKPVVEEIKKFADAVNLPRGSLATIRDGFLASSTNVAEMMHSANISVYASVFRNEFVALAFDFLSDPIIQISTFVDGFEVDGIVTEFPGTANEYLRSPCFKPAKNTAYAIRPASPGGLLNLLPPEVSPPAEPPAPVLAEADIIDPPLPKVADVASNQPATAPVSLPSGQSANSINLALCLGMLMLSLVSVRYH
ncbi:glycerophosphodiester phosphodiesterase GDPDL7-like [Aristolochia californica]|uniref:glycerophosphodiester phosphodiesterase GDPDL7-like n=1 Tax=Aristolochia californica TaxID=171875 RepID=UPI0035D7B155